MFIVHLVGHMFVFCRLLLKQCIVLFIPQTRT